MTVALEWSGEERAMWKLVGKGSRRGSTFPSRASDIARQPLFWAGVATALALSGPRGRRAALRGGACYATTGLLHLPIKRLIGRRHPRGAGLMRIGPVTSSFPSGHAASDLSFYLRRRAGAPAPLRPTLCSYRRRSLGAHPRPRALPERRIRRRRARHSGRARGVVALAAASSRRRRRGSQRQAVGRPECTTVR